jgi:ABC-type transporter Mla MlaB component
MVALSGAMTVPHAAEIRLALLEALGSHGALQLDVEGVQEVDITGLQLLCSANREALKRGSSFDVRGIFRGAVGHTAKLAGFPRHCACAHNKNSSCIWVGGENNG